MTIKQDQKRYERACHAMQTGVALEISKAEAGYVDESASSPKHLRVGINSAMVEHSALVRLLLKKEVITWAEYWEAQADAMEEEVARYEARMPPGVHLH